MFTTVVVLVVAGLVITSISYRSGGTPKDEGWKPTAMPSRTGGPPLHDFGAIVPTVTGEFGKRADITLPDAAPDGTFAARTLIEGTGPVITDKTYVNVAFTAKNWTTGASIPGSYDQGGTPHVYQNGVHEVVPAMEDPLVGHRVGSRIVVAAPPAAAFRDAGNKEMKVGPKDTLVFVLDVLDAAPPAGTVQGQMTPAPADMPKVTADSANRPLIAVSSQVPAPTALKSTVLVKGTGPVLGKNQPVVVQYTGVLYANGKRFDSSFERGEALGFIMGGQQVIQGWEDGLIGQTVGSRVELVVPPALAYKDKASGDIPPNATLVFVVDILLTGSPVEPVG
ncbi:FKBP-type peptidyl-prolyl cis-trans isomerase [Kitasatospora sp. NPDC057015]|uniref:FKBP-type peptidyl-prolyl cis-trans isomerase n=1 Tax=Kitasatospora sp. NPDC057015 TaxID=3346001 RepID=UPI00362997E5